jgi:hypothetical protein
VSRQQREASVWSHPDHPYWSAPRDLWLITRTKVGDTYPCRCSARCRPRRCPCSGRTDGIKSMPPSCCARRAAETLERYKKQEPGGV